MIGCETRTAELVRRLSDGIETARRRAQALPRRPRVYFEEWDEPLISSIRWVSEVIGIAGGDDCFPELSQQALGRNRIIADAAEVTRRAPDIIFGSWCGKKFQPDEVAARPGWSAIPAVRSGFVREIKSPIILQPGPAALTDGLHAVQAVIEEWAGKSTTSPDARE
jgi:iron complex transport system substrate-binding protein